MPNRKSCTGISIAATTPPALNSIQKKASFDGFAMLCLTSPLTQNQPAYERGHDQPRNIAGGGDQNVREPFSSQAHRHSAGRQVEPRNRVEDDKEKTHDVENDDQRIAHALLKLRISLGTVAQGAQQKQGLDHEDGDKDATQLAQNELEVVPLAQPPVHRHTWAIPSRMELRVARRSFGRSLIHGGHFWNLSPISQIALCQDTASAVPQRG